jgi:hypothetical protein
MPDFNFRIALLFAVAAVCAAQSSDKPSKPSEKSTTTPSSPSQMGVMMFIDPATGKIVEPTASQLAAAPGATGGNLQPKAPLVFRQGPGGTVGLLLDQGAFLHSVATRSADGKLVVECVAGSEAAEQRVTSGTQNEAKK